LVISGAKLHSRSSFSPFHNGCTGINYWGWAGKGSISRRTRDCSTSSRIGSVCGQNLELNIGRSAAKPRAQFEPVKMRGLPTAKVAVGLLERRACLKLQKKFRLERPPEGRRGRPGRWCARRTLGQGYRGTHPVRTSDWRGDAA